MWPDNPNPGLRPVPLNPAAHTYNVAGVFSMPSLKLFEFEDRAVALVSIAPSEQLRAWVWTGKSPSSKNWVESPALARAG